MIEIPDDLALADRYVAQTKRRLNELGQPHSSSGDSRPRHSPGRGDLPRHAKDALRPAGTPRAAPVRAAGPVGRVGPGPAGDAHALPTVGKASASSISWNSRPARRTT